MLRRFAAVAACVFALSACGVPEATIDEGVNPDPESSSETAELSSSRADKWFPLAEGNSWTLWGPDSGKVIKVTYAKDGVYKLTGLDDTDVWLGTSSSTPNTLYYWDSAAQQWNVMVRFGYAKTHWTFAESSGTCGSFDAYRSATGQVIQNGDLSFSDTRTVAFDQKASSTAKCAPAAFSEMTFAANVGPVAIKTGDGEPLGITEAHVGSQVYKPTVTPAPSGVVSTKITADKLSYVNVPNTIRCITTPCPSNEATASATFTLTVTNNKTTAVKYAFSSGMQFNFELIDSNGKTVAAWADGRIFNQALTAVMLQPGQSQDFKGTVALKDRSGNQLNGTYTVRGYLNANMAPPPPAELQINVSVQ